MGDYLTIPGGDVNLEKVDIILAEVGKVEDEVRQTRIIILLWMTLYCRCD